MGFFVWMRLEKRVGAKNYIAHCLSIAFPKILKVTPTIKFLIIWDKCRHSWNYNTWGASKKSSHKLNAN